MVQIRRDVRTSAFPGFDGIRLLAAISVVFSHAFSIAEGSERNEPFYRLLGPGNIIGLYAVFTFFIISGFLLTKSLSDKNGIVQFSLNRFLRIFPGFLFCIVVTSIAIGPLVTRLDIAQYFARSDTFESMVSSIFCLCDTWVDSTTFAPNSKVPGVKNGSLWSLSYEALSYLFLLWLWAILRNLHLVAGVAAAILVATLWSSGKLLAGVAYTLPYFVFGIVMYIVYCRFGTKKVFAWISLGLLFTSAIVGFQHYAFAIFGAYLIIHLGQCSNILSRFAQKRGDLSYGLYLFGWPVEQLIQQLARPDNGWMLFALTLPPLLLCAFISWWMVEKPCLKLKTQISQLSILVPDKWAQSRT
jgi:peptidoglycan/LPS O-acetylase OafA/YrhL